MKSKVGAICGLLCRLAPPSLRPSGVPRASVTRWRLVPGLLSPSGLDRWQTPLFGRDRGTAQARSAPVDRTGRVQALQQHLVKARSRAGRLPVAQAPPATHAAAAAHLRRKRRPG